MGEAVKPLSAFVICSLCGTRLRGAWLHTSCRKGACCPSCGRCTVCSGDARVRALKLKEG